jgi:hypothetical protein
VPSSSSESRTMATSFDPSRRCWPETKCVSKYKWDGSVIFKMLTRPDRLRGNGTDTHSACSKTSSVMVEDPNCSGTVIPAREPGRACIAVERRPVYPQLRGNKGTASALLGGGAGTQ